MKKLVLFFAMATVVAFSACQQKAQHETAPEPVQTEETVEPAPAPAPAEEMPAETPETPAETPAE